MKIKNLKIKNFRGFEQKIFDFDDRLTVIVGNNTSGKTTLLQAIQVALGAYLKCLRSLPNDKAYSHNFAQDDVYSFYDSEKKDFFRNPENTRIDADADYTIQNYINGVLSNPEYREISWWRELKGGQTTHSNACAGQLIEAVNEMESMRMSRNTNAVYPLVLSFGANRIDNQYRAAKKTKDRESKIAKGYKSALRETVDFQSAFDWLYRYEQSLKQNTVSEGTKVAFTTALETAIPALSDIFVDTKNKELSAKIQVTGCLPVYQTYGHMSDGFKSMICMVAEIAHRCIELNDFLGVDAVKRTPGVVIIDELDLYLHPRWQKHILKDLEDAFPLIQFIVTSHSPFIIQSVRTKNLITLDGVNDSKDPIYRSIEEIVIKEMNMETSRSEKFQKMISEAERYYQLVKDEKADSAEAVQINEELNKIETEFSDDPAYVALLKAEKESR